MSAGFLPSSFPWITELIQDRVVPLVFVVCLSGYVGTYTSFLAGFVPFKAAIGREHAEGVANGLQYLHEECGVAHRDIKPENIFFEQREDEGEFIPGVGADGIGRVKIGDFSLSKVVWNAETTTGFSSIPGATFHLHDLHLLRGGGL
ncbi:hypothetical protein B0H14DRAFT_3451348 [Mycena olivaceomarginata]|nr:hypothetical protein B0H14DRAFT_3451348 [Mycena olivaceomarginata]